MTSYPVEIRRCRHIKTNGTQCGSPALKGKELCYYHEQNQPAPAELYIDGERYADGEMMIPPFEDAHSIQTVIRHVVQLMLCRRIDRKDAGVMLYALQIASGNLKMMQAEKAKPTQVVVEVEKAAETPLGMTPWSASGEGHDPEEEEDAPEGSDGADSPAEASPAASEKTELYDLMEKDERDALRESFEEHRLIWTGDVIQYRDSRGPDPLKIVLQRIFERKPLCGAEISGVPGGDELPCGRLRAPSCELELCRNGCLTRAAERSSAEG